MSKTQKLLKISDLTLDLDLYPRIKTAWLTVYQYAEAMKAGSVFPAVTVGKLKGKLFLVDGWHRVEARKLLKEEYIEAIVKQYEGKREMFVDAVRLNSVHGRRLSVQEMVRIMYKLEKWHFEPEKIAEIIKVPVDKIEMFRVRTIIGPNGKPLFLKAITAKAGIDQSVNQGLFNVSSVANLLEQLVLMLENEMLVLDDEKVKELAIKVYSLLQERLGLLVKT